MSFLGNNIEIVEPTKIADWDDITAILVGIRQLPHRSPVSKKNLDYQLLAQGTAFLTFDIGIDGVSIEIMKSARVLETEYGSQEDINIHFIAGDFHPQADTILKPRWVRYQIDGINGWSKWADGEWFDALFFEDMPEGSKRSTELAVEIYRQAVKIAQSLGRYLIENSIRLLIPVNVASNPGNMALTLALVLTTEALGIPVININHDFYWDGGKPAHKRKPNDEPGNRDHFFRNYDNRPFFALFKMLFPWNGRRWLQVNINKMQSNRLRRVYGFSKDRVSEITTSIGSDLFDDYTFEDVQSARERMAQILSGGKPLIQSISLSGYQKTLPSWMEDQVPVVVGAKDGLQLDITRSDIIYFLQPTRVIGRKRIEKGVELIQALLNGPMKSSFEMKPKRQLLLHITGPTPLEHQADLERILEAYGHLIGGQPEEFASRLFLAFSVGRQSHACFTEKGFKDLKIADIYRLASAILFPSEIEGRGLPIIESAAVGVPIICSRYQPDEVFATVIGEELPKEYRIRYLPFPEGEFSRGFLSSVASLLNNPAAFKKWRSHNRRAVRIRYSEMAFQRAFHNILDGLHKMSS